MRIFEAAWHAWALPGGVRRRLSLAAAAPRQPVTDAYLGELQAMRLPALRQKLSECGIDSTGKRQILVERLITRLQQVETRESTSTSVLSIDVGYRNLAYAHFELPCAAVELSCRSVDESRRHVASCSLPTFPAPQLLRWERCPLDVQDAYLPRNYGEAVASRVSLLPRADLVLIEQQRHRTLGGAGVFESIFRVNIVEAQLHAIYVTMDVPTLSLPPLKTARFFGLDRCKHKKQAAVQTAERMILTPGALGVPDALRSQFERESKKDDLSDCLLQGIAYLGWRKNALREAIQCAQAGDL